MKSDRSGEYWPGMVDALTNVVFALIIFVMILSLVFIVTIVRVARLEAEKANAKLAEQEYQTTLQKQAEKTNEGQSEKPEISPQKPQGLQDKKASKLERVEVKKDETPQHLIRMAAEGGGLFVTFPGMATELDVAAAAELNRLMAGRIEQLKVSGVELRADANPPFVSVGRRKAYYRIVSIRNWMVSQGVPAEKITQRITDTRFADDAEGVQIFTGSSGDAGQGRKN